MKKSVNAVLCLALVLGLIMTLAACGSDSIAGHYDLVTMDTGDSVIDIASLKAMSGSEIEMYIQLNDDGTAVLQMDSETTEMEWADGKIWPVNDADDKISFTVDGNTLTMEQDGIKLTFEK